MNKVSGFSCVICMFQSTNSSFRESYISNSKEFKFKADYQTKDFDTIDSVCGTARSSAQHVTNSLIHSSDLPMWLV